MRKHEKLEVFWPKFTATTQESEIRVSKVSVQLPLTKMQGCKWQEDNDSNTHRRNSKRKWHLQNFHLECSLTRGWKAYNDTVRQIYVLDWICRNTCLYFLYWGRLQGKHTGPIVLHYRFLERGFEIWIVGFVLGGWGIKEKQEAAEPRHLWLLSL